MKPGNSQYAIDDIFDDEKIFEQVVLDIHNDADRKEVIGIIADEIVNDKLRNQLHFSYLRSYNALKTDGIVKIILQRFSSEAAGYLEERLQLNKKLTLDTIRKTRNLLFLKRLSLFYYKRFGTLVFEKVADTFFEKVAALPSPDNPPPLLREAIEGSGKRPSLIGGNAVSFKQVWEHTRKANQARKKEMGKVQISLASILNLMESQQEMSEEDRQKLKERYEWNQKNLEAIRTRSLEQFESSVKRMKTTAVQVLQGFE